MGKIKKILEKELGSTQSVEVYPVTSIEAVYDENNERLDSIINRKNKEIQKELKAEVERASNAESNLRETINNLTEINENATAANIVTIDTIPNTSSSNVQQALNELFKNATFAGVATSTTNPGTPDGPVFYIATTAGNYSNFGNIEVLKGETAILQWNSGTWAKNTFKPMTDFNSVFDAEGKSLGSNISELESEIGEFIRTKDKITTATAPIGYTSVLLSKRISKGQTIKGISGYTGKVLVLSDIEATKFTIINSKIPYVAEFDIEYIRLESAGSVELTIAGTEGSILKNINSLQADIDSLQSDIDIVDKSVEDVKNVIGTSDTTKNYNIQIQTSWYMTPIGDTIPKNSVITSFGNDNIRHIFLYPSSDENGDNVSVQVSKLPYTLTKFDATHIKASASGQAVITAKIESTGLIKDVRTLNDTLEVQQTDIENIKGSIDTLDIDELHIPSVIHAVKNERLLLFKYAITKNDYSNLYMQCNNGRDFLRYLHFIPSSVGDVELIVKNGKHMKTSSISVVEPHNPSSQINILMIGSSTLWNYRNQYEELYRRLVSTDGEEITEFGLKIKSPSNPKGLGLTNINFVGRCTNNQHFNFEATGGYTWGNYYGTARDYNYAIIVPDTSLYSVNAIYTNGTDNFKITEISGSDNRISCKSSKNGAVIGSSLSKVSGEGATTMSVISYSQTISKPFLDAEGNTSLRYYMNKYCNGANVDIVIFGDMMFNTGFWNKAFSNYAEPLLRIIHSEYPSAKIIISSEELGDALHGLAYIYTSELGRTIEVNDKARELVEKTEELIIKMNNEFGSEVCLYCAKPLQCDAEYDYPKKEVSVNNRVTQTELIGVNGIHPTNEGILNQIDSYYRSICYVISKFFN